MLSSQMGSVDLQELVIADGKLTAKFDIQGYMMSLKGGFEGDTYTGSVIIDGNEFPMIATRKPALLENNRFSHRLLINRRVRLGL
ncbi:MAG: hypothetical protein U5K79_23645 [Cyclobacteriaceae bacterium]|nr:hypothetical protein [Cyclobacteriaceae bacterium]